MSTKSKNEVRLRRYGRSAVVWTVRLALLTFLLLPIYNGLRISLTPLSQLGSGRLLPAFYFKPWVHVFDLINLGRQVLNSFIYATSVTVLNLLITVPAAYSLSRYQFTGRKVFMFTLLLTQMFAAIVILPALYIVIRTFGLLDTYASVVVSVVAITIALSVWLLKGFFDSIDIAIEEAAMMDGCSRLQVLRQIVVPMSAPGILTAGIFTFITAYNQFVIPLVFISDESKLPVTVGIYNLFGELSPPYPEVMAATFIGAAPVVLIYIFAQDYIVEGLASGGMKG